MTKPNGKTNVMTNPKHAKFLDIALKIAEANDNFRTKHAAIIVIRNRIISVGVNNLKSDPLQAKYGKNNHAIWIHAEIHAIKNALKVVRVDELKKSCMYVVRYRKDGVTGLAKPCSGCERAIIAFGIKEVIYTNDELGFTVKNYREEL